MQPRRYFRPCHVIVLAYDAWCKLSIHSFELSCIFLPYDPCFVLCGCDNNSFCMPCMSLPQKIFLLMMLLHYHSLSIYQLISSNHVGMGRWRMVPFVHLGVEWHGWLSWAMFPNDANLSPRYMKCLGFGDVTGCVTTFCDVSNSKPPVELAILHDPPN